MEEIRLKDTSILAFIIFVVTWAVSVERVEPVELLSSLDPPKFIAVANEEEALRDYDIERQGYRNYIEPFLVSDLDAKTQIQSELAKTPGLADKLLFRIDGIKLYAHGYTFLLNLENGRMHLEDVVDFALAKDLMGVHFHLDDGAANGLRRMTDDKIKQLLARARAANPDFEFVLEISSLDKDDFNDAVRVAKLLESKRIRVYPREAGPLNAVIRSAKAKLIELAHIAEKNGIDEVVIEQHEDLKSSELSHIVDSVNARLSKRRVFLLFDAGNMVNAYELPLAALERMGDRIRDVHLKDAFFVPVEAQGKFGLAQYGVPSGRGMIPQLTLIYRLLMLEDSNGNALIKSMAMEEEAGFVARAYRFANEEHDNVIIPFREPSETVATPNNLDSRIIEERAIAAMAVETIRGHLDTLKKLASV